MAESSTHRVVIVGGGFGGLQAARSLRRAPAVDVTLVDRRNFHLFQPLLYQVATGSLSPANIASPLRAVLRRQSNARVLLGEVTGFDIAHRHVVMGDQCVAYDSLVIAAGATNFYFGHADWERHAPGLKSVEEATQIRGRVLSAFERAELCADSGRQLTFVVVGGGPTGVEMAGSICELSRHTLLQNFRHIDPARARIILIEGFDRVLPTFVPKLSEKARQALVRMGVEVWTGAKVQDIQADHLVVEREGQKQQLDAAAIVWAAGVRASPLGRTLADGTGATLDRTGRVIVQADLSLPGHPNIFVIGDLAAYPLPDGKFLPGLAPVAQQQGKYIAQLLQSRLKGHATPAPFHYHDQGVMATIGRNAAVVDLRWFAFSGWFAWVTWLFVHIALIIEFDNRLLVLLQWAWNFFTRNRSARLITGSGQDSAPARGQDGFPP